MEVKLAYADSEIGLDVPDWVELDRYDLTAFDQAVTYSDFLESIDSEGGTRLLEGELPLVIVNDGHRSTPTAKILEWLEKYDHRLVDASPYLVACGTHGEPSPEHYRCIFGRFLDRIKPRLAWHDCTDISQMVRVGTDHFNADVWVNRRAVRATKLLVLTSVEPHYFAGFTGGRKSFFPGLANRATIERNHHQANSLECQPLRLAGNPMAEHLDEMLRLFGPEKIFSIQVVCDSAHTIGNVSCGRIDRAFAEAVKASEAIYARITTRPYDLVVAEVRPPLDRSLYQVQKALEHCQTTVVDGGTVVVVAACQDGIGKRNFYDLSDEWDRENNRPKDGIPRFGSHKLSRVLAMTRRFNVRLHSQLPDDQPRHVFYEPVHDLQALLAECLDKNDRKRLAIVHDAGHTVLKLAGAP
jgi:nickel-dependent lactate racemase